MNFQDPQIAALVQALGGAGSLDQSDALLGTQQQTAQANRQQAGGKQAYGWGAGLGQGLAQIFGSLRQNQLADQQKANLGKRDAYTQALIQALTGGGGGAAPQPSGMGAPPSDPGGGYGP